MEIIRQELNLEYFNYPILNEYFGGKSFCTFDIETLGLDPRKAPMILAGFISCDPDGRACMTQYFLDKPEEEHVLLNEVIRELNSYDYIVTYNGRRFDLPYVIKRYQMINHVSPDISPFDLDLYLAVKGFSGLREVLPSMSQKSVESYMGLAGTRDDMISGGESVEMYYKYLTERDPVIKDDLRKSILLHNYDDVIQLYRLLPILKQCDLHASAYKLGFPVYKDDLTLIIENISLNNKCLKVSGSYTGEAFAYRGFSTPECPYDTVFTKDREFNVMIPVKREAASTYINLLEFFPCYGTNEPDRTIPEDLRTLSGFINNFLILKNNNEILYRDINFFIKKLLEKI